MTNCIGNKINDEGRGNDDSENVNKNGKCNENWKK